MPILLKKLLQEQEEVTPLKVQFYCDMDGVLVDMNGGFEKISGGLSPNEYEAKNGKNSFWKIIGKYPTFWLDLEPLPDAKELWSYINQEFKDPRAVILSAGQGTNLAIQKEQWIRKHIDPSVQVIISKKGSEKPNYAINPQDKNILHVLLDDTQLNIDKWNAAGENFVAILHKNAADSISKIEEEIGQWKKSN